MACLTLGLASAQMASTRIAEATETNLAAGVESTVVLPSSANALKVYTPVNYLPTQSWPAIFFYHGMGGAPDTTFIRNLTAGRDYFVVAMPYLEAPLPSATRQDQQNYMQRELTNLHAARAWLANHAHVDETRVFLAGASKGGWTVTALADLDPTRIAGMIVLLAGRTADLAGRQSLNGYLKMPIYIGTGETDPNNIPARRAREFYRHNGAIVTFEEYAGLGHAYPSSPASLTAWLDRHGRCHQNPLPPEVRNELTRQLSTALQSALAETAALPGYNKLAALAADPRIALCESSLIGNLQNQLATARSTSPVKEEWVAETAFGDLLYRESSITTLTEMKSVLTGFQNLGRTYPQTRYGKLATQFSQQIEISYQKSADATRKANEGRKVVTKSTPTITPTFPTDNSRPMAPVIKGNKIIFRPPGEH
jgi:predicted esterase